MTLQAGVDVKVSSGCVLTELERGVRFLSVEPPSSAVMRPARLVDSRRLASVDYRDVVKDSGQRVSKYLRDDASLSILFGAGCVAD